MKSLLEKLNIQPVNSGACIGPDGWLMDSKGKELVSYNPATGDALAKVIQATPETYEKVASTAQESFLKWREVPAPKRGEVVRDLGDALREFKEPLGDLVTVEMGKIRAEGHAEVQEMIDICDFAVGQSRMLYGLSMHSERPAHRMFEQWHPLGILGLVTAFNFPVAVWSWNSALAAICGDTIIWKPSSYTPLTAIAVTHIANKVMADHGLSGIFNLTIGSGGDVGELMLNDKRVQLVSFTGSTKIGVHVSETVARRFGRTILELGGNNGIIVSEKADLSMATRSILFGAIGTAGQRCTSTRRIIMQKSIANDLTQRLVNAYKQIRIGDPLKPDTLMGPLVVNTSVEEMMDGVRQAVADGGEVLAAGICCPTSAQILLSQPSSKCRLRQKSSKQKPSPRFCTCLSMKPSRRRSAFTTMCHRAFQARCSPTRCGKLRPSSPPPGPIAVLPTSTAAPPAQRSAELLAVKKKLVAAANPARMSGRPTCAARLIRLIGRRICR